MDLLRALPHELRGVWIQSRINASFQVTRFIFEQFVKVATIFHDHGQHIVAGGRWNIIVVRLVKVRKGSEQLAQIRGYRLHLLRHTHTPKCTL